ncbi:MAG: hypothetical protein Q8P72_02660 [Candidatus Roizmanbacteria bacterium]|nr:hypothetical protein [Candidatus Roizmanbacteria bacterium]
MDLQNAFYIFAIVVFSLGIVFLVVGIALIWKIFDTLRSIPKKLEEKISGIVQSKAAMFVGSVGIPLVAILVKKIKRRFGKDE